MNYKYHYDMLILKYGRLALPIDGYYERHHIIPKSLGGSNSISNLTYLTARQHLLAHWLLMKIHNNGAMRHAYSLMCHSFDKVGKLSPKMYEIAAKATSGKNHIKAKSVKTPLGVFDTVTEASNAHGENKATICRKLKSTSNWLKDWQYVDNEVDKNEASKRVGVDRLRVHTPLGWFDSVRKAAIAHNIYHSSISKKCRNTNPMYDDYYYEESCASNKLKVQRKVHTPLGWFDSVSAAAKAHKVGGAGTISTRCKVGWKDYYYSE